MSGSGISWAVCKSAPHSREITMPAPHHSVFYRPDVLPATNQQRQSTEVNKIRSKIKTNSIRFTKTETNATPFCNIQNPLQTGCPFRHPTNSVKALKAINEIQLYNNHSVKSRLVLPFWYWLTRIVPDKGPLNGCVSV